MAKKKTKPAGTMGDSKFSGGTGNITQAFKETPEEVKQFLSKAIKVEA